MMAIAEDPPIVLHRRFELSQTGIGVAEIVLNVGIAIVAQRG
jgi:hypothetical protein